MKTTKSPSLTHVRRNRVQVLLAACLICLSFSFSTDRFESPFRAGRVEGGGTVQPCPGDVTLDGSREIDDFLALVRHILGIDQLHGTALSNGDANRDSRVDAGDLVRFLGDQLGAQPLAECRSESETPAPFIRYLAPLKGPPGAQFTLIGKNFKTDPEANKVVFVQLDEPVEAEILSATDSVLIGIVPPTLPLPPTLAGQEASPQVHYAVTVVIDEQESNGVGFLLSNETAPLEIIPSEATLLLSPGSGVETFLITGGVPPYSLMPLSEYEKANFEIVQEGSLIQVSSIGDSPAGMNLNVEDSSDPPASAEALLSKQEPEFEVGFEVLPHSLIAGGVPGIEFSLSFRSQSMRAREVHLTFQNMEFDFSRLSPGQILGLITVQRFTDIADLQFMQIREVGEGTATFDMWRYGEPETLVQPGEGRLSSHPAQLLLRELPDPPAEGIFDGDFRFEVLLTDQLLRLPQTAGAKFAVQADFTSVTVLRDRELPMRAQLSQEFLTLPRPTPLVLDRMYPVRSAVGGTITLIGTGFDPESSRVTFDSIDGERVPARILEASETEIQVAVPDRASSGVVRVENGELQSNPYPIRVFFHAVAAVFFSQLKPGQPAAPWFQVNHPALLDEYGDIVDELRMETAVFRLAGASNVESLGLTFDQEVGTASLRNLKTGDITPLLLFYSGEEMADPCPESGCRKVFELRIRKTNQTVFGRILVSEREDGVLFELENPITPSGRPLANPNLEWMVEFSAPIFVPPASGDSFQVETTTRSTRWNGLFNSNREVVYRYPVSFADPGE